MGYFWWYDDQHGLRYCSYTCQYNTRDTFGFALLKRNSAKVRPTKRVGVKMIMGLGIILFAGTGGWGYILTEYTDASIPYADAFIAILSVIAQFLLSYKMLEHWLVWIIVDLLSIGMYFYKGLDAVAFLYIIYLFIAITGWISWRNGYQRKTAV